MSMGLRNSGKVAYGVIFDNLQFINAPNTRRLTNLYGLLYESLLFSDSWLYTNPALQDLVFSREGTELFRQKILLPFKRDNTDSFDALRSSVISKNMYGLTERTLSDSGMGAELDRIIADNFIEFPLSEVGATFKRMSAEVFQRQFLIKLGFTEEEATKALQVIEETKGQDNSVIVNSILRLFAGDKTRSDFIIEVSRAPYVLNLPNIFKTGLIGPEGFRGDKILSALYSSSSVATLDVQDVSDQAEGYSGIIEDPFANWLLQPQILGSLTAEELSLGRANPFFQEYLDELPIFLSETEPGQFFSPEKKRQWDSLFARLERHLATAGEDIFRAQLTTGKLGEPKEGGEIKVEGSQTIRIFAPRQPLELHGYAPAQTITVDQVRVVGREMRLPKLVEKEEE
jgi:hypothetical protein